MNTNSIKDSRIRPPRVSLFSLMRIGGSLVLAFTASAQAKNLPSQVKWKCGSQIEAALVSQNIALTGAWRKSPNLVKLVQSYRAPTAQIGTWLVLEQAAKSDTETLIVDSAEKRLRYSFSAPGCDAEFALIAKPTSDRKIASAEYFYDEDLAALLKKQPSGVIYIWSPHMPLSFRAIPQIREAAKALGLGITFLMDPQADHASAVRVAKEYELGSSGTRRVDSHELAMRNALVHFPALIVHREGKICPHIQRGYRRKNRFQTIIESTFGSCR